jgi:hypothetical protein
VDVGNRLADRSVRHVADPAASSHLTMTNGYRLAPTIGHLRPMQPRDPAGLERFAIAIGRRRVPFVVREQVPYAVDARVRVQHVIPVDRSVSGARCPNRLHGRC